MAKVITYRPDEVWDYYITHGFSIPEPVELARDNDTVIYLAEDDNFPSVLVTVNGEEFYSEIINGFNCAQDIASVYDEFLGFGDTDLTELDDTILEREEELAGIVYDFLNELIDGEFEESVDDTDDVVKDVTDMLLEYLYTEHGVDVRRPMFLEDDDGEFYEEYPYSHLIRE